jgi:chromosome segregation protein
MILKKLEIQGFKSFADRTEVLFTPGVIAVVGPNGSGKSNISDAILWVLGEQNVRALRGQKAQDVIFAGSTKRKPVGMAEVSLTVDNSSGKLPINYSEVTVTRRAYRSGESEFLINKTPCRLRDIYELFMDTGVGREAYSIVSQGEMDALLSAKPEDRRALFDEAAGIKKYRHRKKEAERKLENTDANLNRVNDILHEIQDEIGPMQEQAEIAKRYLELTSRLNEIEVGILINDLHRLTQDMERVRGQKSESYDSLAELESLIAALEEKKEALAADLAEADAECEKHAALHQESLTHLERLESQLALVNQSHTASGTSERLIQEEIVQLEERAAQVALQRESLNDEYAEAEQNERELAGKLKEKQDNLAQVQSKIEDALRAVDNQKSSYIELAKQLATEKNELVNTTARIASLQNLLEKRLSELSGAEKEAGRSTDEKVRAGEELALVRKEMEGIRKSIESIQSTLKDKNNAKRDAAEELAAAGRSIVDRESRLKALQEMEAAKEGYYLGVRSITQAVRAGHIKGGYAVLADVIKVPKGYEAAYEVALGGSLQDIITDNEQEAKSAIEFLKKNKAGRATFLPLTMMRHSTSPGLRQLVGKNGVLGLGNELIKFNAKYAPAVDSLLGKVLIVENIDSAISVSKSAMGWSKIVSLDGELIFPSGAMTGGNAPGRTVNILGRKQEIENLQAELNSLKSRAASAEKRLDTLEDETAALDTRLKGVLEQDTGLKMSLLEKERRLEFASREESRLLQDVESLSAEKENLEGELAKCRENHERLTLSIEKAESENSNLDTLIEETRTVAQKFQSEYDAVMAEINSINVSVASLTQKRLGVEQAIENVEESAREIGSEIGRKKAQLGNTLQERSVAESRRVELKDEQEKARAACLARESESERWRKTKQAILASSLEAGEQLKEASLKREDTTARHHSEDLKETRLDVQIAQTSTRLLEEYDITPEDALRREAAEVKYGAATEVVRLRREIKGMGEVNTGAVQEYERLSERFEFLSTQRQDLMDAREKLVEAIRGIDESTRGVFEETFEAVKKSFAEMFQRLFDGGKTELVLVDPENMLESGIDVLVELPGKKRQNLLLLSGGERALTAAALMFALMMVRPSPFCVLDEVDAPLDEANVERFADVIQEFAEKSQMIVITHNKSTMEKADIMYGVTMQEPGISKLVSVKLSAVAEMN